jgi:phosphoribosylaminoimidazole-succinocarboxamide synthase
MPKRWSVKSLTVVRAPDGDREGIGIFDFTDDYSVFHYGKMPDRIPGKGEALCRMAVTNLEKLEAEGIETHFRRFIPPNRMEVRLLRILDPDYGELYPNARNCLIPLQVIFRNLLPHGCSVFRRLASEELLTERLGLEQAPEPGHVLAQPFIEFTTKLEEIDRFVTDPDAQCLACLNDRQMERIKDLTLRINDWVTHRAKSVGLVHADGKVEFGLSGSGEIILVDVAGTTDDNRFLLGDFHVSKQVMRDVYETSDLGAQVRSWAAKGIPREDWPRAPSLPRELLPAISNQYKAMAETWTGQRFWGAPSLADAVRSLKTIQQQLGVWPASDIEERAQR